MNKQAVLFAVLALTLVGIAGWWYTNQSSAPEGFAVGENGYSYNAEAGGVFWFTEKQYALQYAEANRLHDPQKVLGVSAEGKGTFVPNEIPLIILEVDGPLRRVQGGSAYLPYYEADPTLTGWVSVEFISKTLR